MDFANCQTLESYLEQCKSKKFSGVVSLRSVEGFVWNLHFFVGRIVGESGGIAPEARWKRHLRKVSPKQDWHAISEMCNGASNSGQCWNSDISYRLLEKKIIDRRQAKAACRGSIIDTLFDIALEEERAASHKAPPLAFTLTPNSNLSEDKSLLLPLDIEDVWTAVISQLDKWVKANGNYESPNVIPEIVNLNVLQKLLPRDICQLFIKLMDGQRSLRDIASILGKEVDTLYLSLSPFILSKAVVLKPFSKTSTKVAVNAGDIPSEVPQKDSNSALNSHPAPNYSTRVKSKRVSALVHKSSSAKVTRTVSRKGKPALVETNNDVSGNPPENNSGTKSSNSISSSERHEKINLTVAFIDDDPADLQVMRQLLSRLGCKIVLNSLGSKVLPTVLKKENPDMLFLGLEDTTSLLYHMERIAPPKHLPIVIVSAKDRIVDRMRAKLAGAYGFIPKPLVEGDVEKLVSRFFFEQQA